MHVALRDTFIQHVCEKLYNLSGADCSTGQGLNTTAKQMIESTTANYIQGYTVMEAVVPSIFCLLIGPWTDLHGRKWPLVCS